MFFILVLRAVVAVVNTYAAIKNALMPATYSNPKTRTTIVGTKHSIQVHRKCDETDGITTVDALKDAVLSQLQHITPRSQRLSLTQHAHNALPAPVALKAYRSAFYAMVERIVCAGFVRQHAILHLHAPEDLLVGFWVDFRILDKGDILIPGFEKFQLERKGKLVIPESHDEPIYWKRFHLLVDVQILRKAGMVIPGFEECHFKDVKYAPGPHEEPVYVKPRRCRVNAPCRIEMPSEDITAEAQEERQEANWSIFTGEANLLKEKIAFYQDRVNEGKSHLHSVRNVPEGPDYLSCKLYQMAYEWNQSHFMFERDPEGSMKRFQEDPEPEEQSKECREAAEQYQHLCPEGFEKYFPGTLEPADETDDEELAVEPEPSPPSNRLFLHSPALSFSYSSLSPAPISKLAPRDRRFSNDSGYSSGDNFDIDADGVSKDIATIHVAASYRRWSDFPSTNDFLTHESCMQLDEYALKRAADINQSPLYLDWSATAQYDDLEVRFGPLGYDQRLYGPVPQCQ